VTMMDHWLGVFIRRLRRLRLERNTAIVVLSDHGLLLGDRGWTGKIPNELHPELAQVPFILVHPEARGAGSVSQHFATTSDVGPTLLSLAGLPVPPWMEGLDLSPLFDGAEPAEQRRFHYGGYFNRFYLRTDDWALLGDAGGVELELYDLTLDRYERKDVAQRHRDVREGLYAQLLDVVGGPLPRYELDLNELRAIPYGTQPFRIEPTLGRQAASAPSA